jgi:predicted ATP-grasp superfamily ATP-dependent carboligase
MSSVRTWPATAVVSSCEYPNGLATIRSLGRRGIDVVAVDDDRRAVGMNSRYARIVLAPSPNRPENEDAFIASLLELGNGFDSPAVFFATSDPVLSVVARNRDVLGGRFVYPFPAWDTLGPTQDKWVQVRTAEAAGIPVPRTAAEPTAELGFPVVVKPETPFPFRLRYPGVHAYLCRNLGETEVAFDRCADFHPLVQEYIPGGDDALYTFGTYVAADGEALGLFSGRKLRQTPPLVGSCRVAEAVWVDDVVEQGLALVHALGYYGICQVEFKLDRRDGRFKLIEANTRPWGWHGLTGACGVDLVRLAYDDLTGTRPPPTRMSNQRKRWAITLLGSTRPAPQRPPYVDGIFATDDLRPFVADLRHQARMGVRRLRNLFASS